MNGVNKVILIGNLGADPEVRHLPSGASVANFNIATSESYTNKNGEKITNTEWHRIECWEGLAKVAESYLKKGNPVYIEGKLRTEEWQDKEGHTRYTTKVRALNMTLLGGNPQAGAPGQSQQPTAAPAASAPAATGDAAGSPPKDDLPF